MYLAEDLLCIYDNNRKQCLFWHFCPKTSVVFKKKKKISSIKSLEDLTMNLQTVPLSLFCKIEIDSSQNETEFVPLLLDVLTLLYMSLLTSFFKISFYLVIFSIFALRLQRQIYCTRSCPFLSLTHLYILHPVHFYVRSAQHYTASIFFCYPT